MMNGVVVAVLLSLAASTPAAEAARELKQVLCPSRKCTMLHALRMHP